MIGRKLVRLDLSRKLAFSTKWQKRAKEPNRFGVLIRQGESERDEARMERTLAILDNPNADMRTQMQDFTKYGPHTAEAASLKNMIDIDNQMRQSIGFEQRDIYGHYQTSNSNAVDPYDNDSRVLQRMKYTSLRTKSDWEKYRENSTEMLKKYNNDNPQNKEFDKPNESLLKRFKDVMPFGSKTNDDTFNELLSGEDSFATISQNFDQWSIYFLAHKMMETENWSIAKMDESEEFLKSLCMGPFYEQLKADCFNKTIKWRLNDYYPEETKLIGFDSSPTDLGEIYAAHFYMKSTQSLEVYDRMGNELIYDTEPRLCEEIVTIIRQRPDPFWYGWRLFDKRNVSTLADNLPNMKRTSSVRAQKKQMQVLEQFMRDEAHQSYDIFTGTRNQTKARRYDYYHRGWNYGGTQESDGPTGMGSLEWKFSKLDFLENQHPNLAFRKFTGRNKEFDYFEQHDDSLMFSHKSKTGRQIRRKRARILHKRRTGAIRPTRMGFNVWEVDQPQPK